MKKAHALSLGLLLCFFSFNTSAQKKDIPKTGINVRGGSYYLDDNGKKIAVPLTNITVYKGSEKFMELQSNKKALFEFNLEYGADYKIAYENNPGYIFECYLIEAAKIPPAKQDRLMKIESDAVLIRDTQTDIDTLKFHFPYTKLKFDNDKKFVDDAKYLQDFMKGIFKEYKVEKARLKKEALAKNESDLKKAGIKLRKIVGKFFVGSKPVKGIKVNLVDDKGTIIETATTNKFGRFGFSLLDPSKNYFIQADENDTLKLRGTKLTVINKYGTDVMSMNSDASGAFKFQLLSTDSKTFSLLQVDETTLSISGTFTAQMKQGDAETALPNSLVVLINSKGQVIDKAMTDERGNFVFLKLPADQNVLVRLEELDPAFKGMYKATLKDANGKIVSTVENSGLNTFQFAFLAGDDAKIETLEAEENSLKIGGIFSCVTKDGVAKPLKKTKIILVNANGEEVNSTVTDDKGNFLFENLPNDQNFFVRIDELDPSYKGVTKIVMKDENGKVITTMENDGTNSFKFSFLSQKENYITNMLVDEMSILTTMKGKLLTGEDTTTPFANIKVDLYGSGGTLLKSIQTDAQGNFTFRGMKLQLGYFLKLDATDAQVIGAQNMNLADSKGKIYKDYGFEGADYKFYILVSDLMNLATFNTK